MDFEQQKIKDNFAKNLKAGEYMKQMASVWEEIPQIFRFMAMFINDAMHSERFQGSKLLEIGSASTVHNIAAASAYFFNITMSDYVQDNIDNLRLWLKGESALEQFLNIQAGLEGYGNDLETGKRILESRIRKNVKLVTQCDVLTDKILLDSSNDADTSHPFDMIISCLCLEVAPKDFNGYADILKRISNLLKRGGGLLLCGFFQCNFWNVGEKVFNHVYFTEKDLLDALAKGGFGKIDIKTIKDKDKNDMVFEVFGVAAEKL